MIAMMETFGYNNINLRKGLWYLKMCEKKCNLVDDSIEYHQEHLVEHLLYTANIEMPDSEKVILTADIEWFKYVSYKTNVNIYLHLTKASRIQVIVSTIDYNTGMIDFASIRIPKELRHKGLGRQTMECWLKLIYTFTTRHNIEFNKIFGSISSQAGDTPEISKKLYQSFNNYNYAPKLHLVLNEEEFKHNRLEYKLAAN